MKLLLHIQIPILFFHIIIFLCKGGGGHEAEERNNVGTTLFSSKLKNYMNIKMDFFFIQTIGNVCTLAIASCCISLLILFLKPSANIKSYTSIPNSSTPDQL